MMILAIFLNNIKKLGGHSFIVKMRSYSVVMVGHRRGVSTTYVKNNIYGTYKME